MRNFKKSCSGCGLEAAVARKICVGCSKPFYTKKTVISNEGNILNETSDLNKIESTLYNENPRKWPERIMRGKPHFYDSTDFQIIGKKKKSRKKRKFTSISSGSSSSSSSSSSTASSSSSYWGLSLWKHPKPSLTAELRKKCKKMDKKVVSKECDKVIIEDTFDYEDSPLKAEQMSLILEEINYKFRITTWRV